MRPNLVYSPVVGATIRLALVSVFLSGASCQAASVMFEAERSFDASGAADNSMIDGLELKGSEDPSSPFQSQALADAASPARAESNLGDKARNVRPEPPTWSLMLFGFFAVGFFAYRRSRKRFSVVSPEEEFDPRRFRGRLQTAFSWSDSDTAHAADTLQDAAAGKTFHYINELNDHVHGSTGARRPRKGKLSPIENGIYFS